MDIEIERKIETIKDDKALLAWQARLQRGWITKDEFVQEVVRIYRRKVKPLGIDPDGPPLLFGFPQNFGDPVTGILVGYPVHQKMQMPPLHLPVEAFTHRHVGTWGLTTFGKTFKLINLLRQVSERKPSQVFFCLDTQGQLPGILANFIPPHRLLTIPVREYWKNLLQDVQKHGLDKAIGILKRALLESVYIGDATVNLLEQVIRRHCTAERLSSFGPPTFKELLDSAKTLDLAGGKGSIISRKLFEYQQSLINVLGNLSLHLGSVYNNPISKGFSFEDFEGKVAVIDISGLRDPIALKFFVAKELLDLTLYVEKPHPPMTVVLDELHRFAPLEKRYGQFAENILIDAVKTMLKYKVNFWFAEQNPGMMVNPAIFANTGTHFAFRMPSVKDRWPVLYAINVSGKEQEQAVGELEKRHCLVYSDSLGKAILIRTPDLDIKDLREEASRWSAPAIEAYHDRFLAESPPGRRASVKEAGTGKPHEGATQSPPSVQELIKKQMAHHRADFPLSGITETYLAVGLSHEIGKRHLKEMLSLRSLEGPERIPAPGKGNKTRDCYVVTEEGCRVLGLDWQKARLPGKGSLKSRLAARMIGTYLEHQGAVVRYEHTLSRGGISKAADVAVLEKDGSITAYEFENTNSHAVENIKRNAEVGFRKTVVVCPTTRALESARKLIERELEPNLKESVTFATLREFAL